MIDIKIDGHKIELSDDQLHVTDITSPPTEGPVTKKKTVLDVANDNEIWIPTICENQNVKKFVGCRLCLVEISNKNNPDKSLLLPPCCIEIVDGLIIKTDSKRVKEARTFILELLIARCPDVPELKELAREMKIPIDRENIDPVGYYLLYRASRKLETNCILCGLCIRACEEVSERFAISFSGRGMNRKVCTPFGDISNTCIGCGLCAHVCPTNAITVEEAD